MNEKVGFLNVFFRQDSESLRFSVPHYIADHIPSLMFLYDAGSRKIQYSNQKLIDFTGVAWNESSAHFVESFIHPEDLAAFEALVFASGDVRGKQRNQSILRFADIHGHYIFHGVEGCALNQSVTGKDPVILFIANDITEELKTKEEIETT